MAGKKVSITAIIGVNSSALLRGLKRAGMKMKAWAKATMARMAAIAKAGVAIAAAAFGIFAYKSLKEFASFEQGMNEVFTLLPGITKKGMAAMEAHTLKLAKTMGVIPEEVVPALYQALSAGVPAKNVFAFLETSVKASKAGVVDLGTAVDVLTTIVNTYGKENITAAKAADLMFEAVKMGKTTFGEMAATLYNVLPIAKAAKVSFADVAAATATMTAKGTPTAQVMTQLKAAIQSIIAPSVRSAKKFKDYGLNVKELGEIMAGPGGLVKAMNMIKEATNGDMQAMRMLLGSVEAINAVLTLTSDGGAQFVRILTGMTNTSNQAGVAFSMMDQGMRRAFEKMSAAMKVAMIKFGKALSPLIQKVTPALMGIIAWIDRIPWARIINGFARVWVIGLRPTFQAIGAAISGMPWHLLVEYLLPIAGLLIRTFQKIGKIIVALAPVIIPAIQAMAGYFTILYARFFIIVHFLEKIAVEVGNVWKSVLRIIAAAMNFVIFPTRKKFKKLVEFMKEEFELLGDNIQRLWARVWEVMKETFTKIGTGIKNAWAELIDTLWSKAAEFLGKIPGFNDMAESIRQTWYEIRYALEADLKALLDAFSGLFDGMGSGLDDVGGLEKAMAWLKKSAGELLVGLMGLFKELMKLGAMFYQLNIQLLTQLAPSFKVLLPVAMKIAAAFIFFFIEGLKACIWLLTQVVKEVLRWAPVFSVIVEVVAGFVAAVVEGLKGIWFVLKTTYTLAKDGLGELAEFFVVAFYKIKDVVSSVIKFIIGLFKSLKDFVFQILFGGTITKDFKKAFDYIEEKVLKVLGAIFDIFRKFEEICDKHLKVVLRIFEVVFGGVLGIVESLGATVTSVFASMENMVVSLLKAFTNMAKIIERIFDKILKLGGKAIDLAAKAAGAVGGFFGRAADAVGLGGGGGGRGRGVGAPGPGVGALTTNLKPIVEKLNSMDTSLKSIDTTLKGKFVNQ